MTTESEVTKFTTYRPMATIAWKRPPRLQPGTVQLTPICLCTAQTGRWTVVKWLTVWCSSASASLTRCRQFLAYLCPKWDRPSVKSGNSCLLVAKLIMDNLRPRFCERNCTCPPSNLHIQGVYIVHQMDAPGVPCSAWLRRRASDQIRKFQSCTDNSEHCRIEFICYVFCIEIFLSIFLLSVNYKTDM